VFLALTGHAAEQDAAEQERETAREQQEQVA
jgi:hypothetical protein